MESSNPFPIPTLKYIQIHVNTRKKVLFRSGYSKTKPTYHDYMAVFAITRPVKHFFTCFYDNMAECRASRPSQNMRVSPILSLLNLIFF